LHSVLNENLVKEGEMMAGAGRRIGNERSGLKKGCYVNMESKVKYQWKSLIFKDGGSTF
jgi:hypothetical protein